MVRDTESLENIVKDEYGTHLRTIARYDSDDFDFIFLRKDVNDDYSANEMEKIFKELRMEDILDDYQEGLYHLGEVLATQRLFERGVICHVNLGNGSGVIVTLDPEGAQDAAELSHLVVDYLIS